MVDKPTYQKHELEGIDWAPTPGPQIPESIKEIDRRDIGNEEQEAGSPNESDIYPGKSVDFSGWNSRDDPENPKNWSFRKKALHTAIPALYGFVV